MERFRSPSTSRIVPFHSMGSYISIFSIRCSAFHLPDSLAIFRVPCPVFRIAPDSGEDGEIPIAVRKPHYPLPSCIHFPPSGLLSDIRYSVFRIPYCSRFGKIWRECDRRPKAVFSIQCHPHSIFRVLHSGLTDVLYPVFRIPYSALHQIREKMERFRSPAQEAPSGLNPSTYRLMSRYLQQSETLIKKGGNINHRSKVIKKVCDYYACKGAPRTYVKCLFSRTPRVWFSSFFCIIGTFFEGGGTSTLISTST